MSGILLLRRKRGGEDMVDRLKKLSQNVAEKSEKTSSKVTDGLLDMGKKAEKEVFKKVR